MKTIFSLGYALVFLCLSMNSFACGGEAALCSKDGYCCSSRCVAGSCDGG